MSTAEQILAESRRAVEDYGPKDHEGPYRKGQIVWRTRGDGARRDARVIESHSKSTVLADGGRFTLLNEQISESK